MAGHATVERPSRSDRQAVKLEAALSGLEALDLDGLRSRWHALTGRPPPATFRAPLLRAAVAYTLQARALGELKPSTARLLHRVANAADPGRHDRNTDPMQPGVALPGLAKVQRRTPSTSLRIKPGTRLLRTWQGITHEVLVGEGTVTYRGRSYRSLSEIARLITGQRWSGPLFFGLK